MGIFERFLRKFLKALLRYLIHNNGPDGQTIELKDIQTDNPKTSPVKTCAVGTFVAIVTEKWSCSIDF